jgi:CRP-like cAMP-binding protein
MLGNSDGFDKTGTTTGFIVWMNRRGIMVDPPPHTSTILKRAGISPRLIHSLILTHCHADHDAGTFQRILEESKMVVMTTPVILKSFITKYSAISGLPASFLSKLFTFRPVIVGERISVYGGKLEFFYSLHSIPCVGFKSFCNGKSTIYSADTFNDPKGIDCYFEAGAVSAGRRDKLKNFEWHHTVILHEAGVPPIHTPLETLSALPEDVRERLYVVHKNPSTIPPDCGLKPALVGPENTIIISQERSPNFRALEILDLVGNIDLFADFIVARGIEFVQSSLWKEYKKGDVLIQEGTTGESIIIMAMGYVAVSVPGVGVVKTLTVGDHFGEMSIVTGAKRTATIYALTDVETVEYSKPEFLHLVRRTNAIERLKHLGAMQRQQSWQVISCNSILEKLTSAQKTYLQSILHWRELKKGDVLWVAGEAATEAVLIESGRFSFARAREMAPFTKGAFVGDMNAIMDGGELTTSLICVEKGCVYYVTKTDLLKFFEDNPGFQVFFMSRRFVE